MYSARMASPKANNPINKAKIDIVKAAISTKLLYLMEKFFFSNYWI